MSILKVESTRWEIRRDEQEYNVFVWTGLTLGNLRTLRRVLEANIKSPEISGLSREMFRCVDDAIVLATAAEDAALAKAQASAMMPKGVR